MNVGSCKNTTCFNGYLFFISIFIFIFLFKQFYSKLDGICYSVNGKETCFCPENNYGKFCEWNDLRILACKNNRCNESNFFFLNQIINFYFYFVIFFKGGSCYLINDKETCQCNGNYYGENCEIENYNVTTTHFCLNKTCSNGLKKKKSFDFNQKSLKNKFNIKKEVLV